MNNFESLLKQIQNTTKYDTQKLTTQICQFLIENSYAINGHKEFLRCNDLMREHNFFLEAEACENSLNLSKRMNSKIINLQTQNSKIIKTLFEKSMPDVAQSLISCHEISINKDLLKQLVNAYETEEMISKQYDLFHNSAFLLDPIDLPKTGLVEKFYDLLD